MSDLGDIETAVVDLLASIQDEGANVFASTVAHAGVSRSDRLAVIRRLVKPAALVVLDGRAKSTGDFPTVQEPKLTVLLAGESLRGSQEARSGSAEVHGGFDLLDLARTALDGVTIIDSRRIEPIDEQLIEADERLVVYEQRYLVRWMTGTQAPQFGGEEILGSDSVVQVLIGSPEPEYVEFSFPGIDGVFRHCTGLRRRAIIWRGQLRGDNDGDVMNLELAIEAEIGSGQAKSMRDPWNRMYAECTMDAFDRKGFRRRHPVTGQVLQDFEIHFTQLLP